MTQELLPPADETDRLAQARLPEVLRRIDAVERTRRRRRRTLLVGVPLVAAVLVVGGFALPALAPQSSDVMSAGGTSGESSPTSGGVAADGSVPQNASAGSLSCEGAAAVAGRAEFSGDPTTACERLLRLPAGSLDDAVVCEGPSRAISVYADDPATCATHDQKVWTR